VSQPRKDDAASPYRDVDPDRFWSKVTRSDGAACWLWRGALRGGGYGTINVRGRMLQAHRVSLYLATGVLGEVAQHSCDVRACVRPDHLTWGNTQTNVSDAVRKGRRGKLNDAAVREIRQEHAAGVVGSDIAKRHGIAPSMVSYIVNRKLWRHIP
jgi:hypothetical protein